MFPQSSSYDPCGLANAKDTLCDDSLRHSLSLPFAEDGKHFLSEPFAVAGGVKTQRMSIKSDAKPWPAEWAEHRSCLLRRDSQIRQTSEMFHPAYFELQISASPRRQAISLPAARTVLFFEALDPLFIQQTAQRAIERPGAEPHTSVAHLLNIFKNRVSMPRLLRQTEKNEQDGLGKRQEFDCSFWRHVGQRHIARN